jgi:hypothetical protein
MIIVIVKGKNNIPNEKEKYEDGYNDDTQRDIELENIAGNLMIAEYQVDKLRQKVGHHIRDIRYDSFNSAKTSAHTFKYNGKWYKLSVKAEELSLDSSSISSNND